MKVKLLFILLLGVQIIIYSQGIHNKYDNILHKYVKHGLVDYSALKNDKEFEDYIKEIESFDISTLSDKNEKLAFWINVYNAFTLKVVKDNYPIESINELHTGGRILAHIFSSTVWDKDLFKVGGEKISLNEIEHVKIRKELNEPRIHFALVCAAISCPELRDEAYSAEKIDAQLDNQAERFISAYGKNYFDLKKRKAFLSKIFDWYEGDFGNSEKDVLIFLSKYLNGEIASDLKSNIDKWEVEYLPYDWKLNDIANN